MQYNLYRNPGDGPYTVIDRVQQLPDWEDYLIWHSTYSLIIKRRDNGYKLIRIQSII